MNVSKLPKIRRGLWHSLAYVHDEIRYMFSSEAKLQLAPSGAETEMLYCSS